MSTAYAFHACARFGLGARQGELHEIGNDPREWLLHQLNAPIIPAEVTKRYGIRSPLGEMMRAGKDSDPANAKRKLREKIDTYVKESSARMMVHIVSQQPFIERQVLFWSNHFTVSVQKPVIIDLANAYEVEAIRPHVTGYFKDMLLAVCRHPAMLAYLDNIQSFGPNSMAGIRQKRGLNENLAREILELHTLGVDGGYSQTDVIALAKIITGWSLNHKLRTPGATYAFQQRLHEPGDKVLLGRTFTESGEEEGIAALVMLAEHPSTARHIATKLARHFISDTPPQTAIDALTKSYMDSQGHLPTIIRTLIDLPESWQHPLEKMKTSYEFAVSALRLSGLTPTVQQLAMGLEALNFRPFNAPSPAGLDDEAQSWASPDALMKRIEWGHRLAQRLPAITDPMQLAQAGIGDALSQTTQEAIRRAASGTDGIGLLFASPEFQRR